MREADLWRIENRAAIETYNQHIEQNGLFVDHVRGF